jgi:hypothetical protein
MSHSSILLVHIWAGIVALPSGTAALVFRKGSPRHMLAGKMSIAGTYLAIVRHQPDSGGGGLLTFCMVATAWLTSRRGDGKTSRLDWVALLIPLVLGILTWITGIRDLRSGKRLILAIDFRIARRTSSVGTSSLDFQFFRINHEYDQVAGRSLPSRNGERYEA